MKEIKKEIQKISKILGAFKKFGLFLESNLRKELEGKRRRLKKLEESLEEEIEEIENLIWFGGFCLFGAKEKKKPDSDSNEIMKQVIRITQENQDKLSRIDPVIKKEIFDFLS